MHRPPWCSSVHSGDLTPTTPLFPHPLSLVPRRRLLLLGALLCPLQPAGARAAQPTAAQAGPSALLRRALQFPRDLGSHPDSGIEWWYATGALQAGTRLFGFQLTFFRARMAPTQTMRSNFAARQLIFAHAAVSDVQGQRLLHDQRIARSAGAAGVDLASASPDDTHIWLRDWSLRREAERYLALAQGSGFAFTLQLQPTQPLLLQGQKGYSRKGPQEAQASFYYSLPQLQVSGRLTLLGQTLPVSGRAWLDHEWSHTLLHPDAVGWDWIGINFDDGSALTAFQLRRRDSTALWAGGSWRTAGGAAALNLTPDEVRFTPERYWTSPASGTSYPVQWTVAVRTGETRAQLPSAGWQTYRVRSLFDDQELDSRQSTGAIYWEGLSDFLDAQGQRLGRGYLEMTGYASPLRL